VGGGRAGTTVRQSAAILRSPTRLAEKFQIDTIVPTELEQLDIDRIIFDEPDQGVFPETSKARYLGIIDRA
jgi:aspartate/glutamate racemase